MLVRVGWQRQRDRFIEREGLQVGDAGESSGDGHVVQGASGIFAAGHAGTVGVVGHDGVKGYAIRGPQR